MPPKIRTASACSPEVDEDPVASAFESAPLDDLPETDEEREAVAAARANPVFVSGAEVSAMIAERRRREEG